MESKELMEVISVCVQCEEDTHEDKIDLIPGAYRDENGNPWIMPFIHDLEKKLVQSSTHNHEYVIFLGLDEFKELAPKLVLGKNSPLLENGRAFGVQTVSGSGALRIGAEYLVRHAKLTTFYISEPTWDNHEAIFTYAGFANARFYRYWDPIKRGVDFKGMMEDLRQAPENSVIVLQMCAHNPTGCDLSKEQWMEVADVMQERKLFPFFDSAYQGFATGDVEEDAWPVRYFVDRNFEMFIAQSFSKNLGLYSDRTGCLTIVLKDGRQNEVPSIKMLLTIIIRALYLCPGRYGAEIVLKTLQNPILSKEWQKCLKIMVNRLKDMRRQLRNCLEKLGTPGSWDHITSQNGMFSFTGLTEKQVAYLAKEYHIYLLPNGRANMCALNNNNLERFAQAVHKAVTNVNS